MTTDDTFANWLRANPAPDLQELKLVKIGRASRVPADSLLELCQRTDATARQEKADPQTQPAAVARFAQAMKRAKRAKAARRNAEER